jgi:hypothetical protein
VGPVPIVATPTLLDVARVIAGCKLFVGNQSCPRAIAEGLKVPVASSHGRHNTCHFARPDAWYDRLPPPELFPLMGEVTGWDRKEGDAQALPGVADGAYDFLHSSHCLEHLYYPHVALRRWCEVVRPAATW